VTTADETIAAADRIAVAAVPAAVLDSNAVPAVRTVIRVDTPVPRAVLSSFPKC
jgi:hypothetical protein